MNSSRGIHLDDLPNEIMSAIITDIPGTWDLVQLALVNRKLARVAQRELYRRPITVTSIGAYSGKRWQLPNLLRTAIARPDLTKTVPSLTIRRWTEQDQRVKPLTTLFRPEEFEELERKAAELGLPADGIHAINAQLMVDGIVAVLLYLLSPSLMHLDLPISDNLSQDAFRIYRNDNIPVELTLHAEQDSACIARLFHRIYKPSQNLFPKLESVRIRLPSVFDPPETYQALLRTYSPTRILPLFAISSLKSMSISGMGLPSLEFLQPETPGPIEDDSGYSSSGSESDISVPYSDTSDTPSFLLAHRNWPIFPVSFKSNPTLKSLHFHQSLLQPKLLQHILPKLPSLESLTLDYHILVHDEERPPSHDASLLSYDNQLDGLLIIPPASGPITPPTLHLPDVQPIVYPPQIPLLTPYRNTLKALDLRAYFLYAGIPEDYTLDAGRYIKPIGTSLPLFPALKKLTISWVLLMGAPRAPDWPHSLWSWTQLGEAARMPLAARIPDGLEELVIWDDDAGGLFGNLWALPADEEGWELWMEEEDKWYGRSEGMWVKLEEFVEGLRDGTLLRRLVVVTLQDGEVESEWLRPREEAVRGFAEMCGEVGVEFEWRGRVREFSVQRSNDEGEAVYRGLD
ncbi:hypothetical protein BJ508DRAFT_123732 [Ascobolus immersus RN42]|uniref:F-box domain-containing protein n=1 Tax=Ascobolus immersus RN42 TaxID=1160509 RepID=A0A3N4I427_ASCIM|nr:hypothetical protein BJ508DRAFT_123732 [Ascobolus immersus RN42]